MHGRRDLRDTQGLNQPILRQFAARPGTTVNRGFAQVSGIYGHAEAQTIVENCGNTLILRCSASENGGIARFASRLIGEREMVREHITTNDGRGFFSRGQATTSKSLQQSPNPQYCRRKSSSSPTFMVSSNSRSSQRGDE